MARIDSKEKLIKYIRQQLGEPVITVEATDDQISQIIDAAIQKFTEYSYGTLDDTVIIQLNGAREYQLPDRITNVVALKTGMSGNLTNFQANFGNFVPDIWTNMFFSDTLTGDLVPTIMSISTQQSLIDKYFATDINFNFNPHRRILQIFEPCQGPAVLHYQYEYLANEHDDLIYNHEWIKAYCTAKTKFLWGSIVGKYSQSLIGGAQINYADIKSEASQEIETLEQELIDKWSDPCGVFLV